MKNIPLVLKIWLVFASLTLSLFMLLAFSLPWSLKGFFTEQIYDILLDSQNAVPQDVIRVSLSPHNLTASLPTVPSQLVVSEVSNSVAISSAAFATEITPVTHSVPETNLAPEADSKPILREKEAKVPASTVLRLTPTSNGPGIQHVIMTQAGIPEKLAGTLPQPFVQAIEKDAGNQLAPTQTYSLSIAERTMFYVISKEQIEGNSGFMISYAWGNYRNDLVMTMFWRLMLLIVALILMSWIPCLWLARYLSRPLVLMEQQAGRMAERDWHEPFILNRKDEMGRLAQAFESMRQRLVRQDKTQQFFLQNVSHELKTPVMVIHSYAQSILDGVYPKGSVTASVETIKSEALRLEKRIKDLLYLNKLNYLTTRERHLSKFDLSRVIEECIERLRYRRQDLSWQINLSQLVVEGDAEQWSVAIENILDNQLRYAQSEIKVSFKGLEDVTPKSHCMEVSPSIWTVCIWNDGPQVNEEELATIFEQFQTGPDGQFGLGLAISRQILAHHHASIRACNESNGVSFYLEANQIEANQHH